MPELRLSHRCQEFQVEGLEANNQAVSGKLNGIFITLREKGWREIRQTNISQWLIWLIIQWVMRGMSGFAKVRASKFAEDLAMKDKHCKDVVEDMVGKRDRHYHRDEEMEPLPELEPLDYQQAIEQHRLHKTQKSLETET